MNFNFYFRSKHKAALHTMKSLKALHTH